MFIFNIYNLRCLLYFVVVVLSCCASLCSEFRVVMSLTISSWKRFSVRLCLQLFVGGLMSCFRYLCLFTYSGVQHILCSVFVLFVVVLCTLCCQFLWIVHCWLPIRYSLTFIVSLPVSLDCPLLIAHSVFSNIFVSLPVSLDCPLLIAHSIFSNIYCISASFSGLSIVDCPFGIL